MTMLYISLPKNTYFSDILFSGLTFIWGVLGVDGEGYYHPTIPKAKPTQHGRRIIAITMVPPADLKPQGISTMGCAKGSGGCQLVWGVELATWDGAETL